MISSTANRQVKTIISLKKSARRRKEEDLFVAEGPRICAEIPPERIASLYFSESFSARKEAESFRRMAPVEVVSDEVFRALSDTQNPQGILALVRQAHYAPDDLRGAGNGSEAPLLLILEHLQDPGNLGTMVRAGEGAGVTGILMDSETVDITSPKVIRSTMGSVFRVPYVYTDNLPSALKRLKKDHVALFAADVRGSEVYDRVDYTGALAFLIGNEAAGLSDETLALADARVRIPTMGKVESLNAAAAASVLLFEAARQRRVLQGCL